MKAENKILDVSKPGPGGGSGSGSGTFSHSPEFRLEDFVAG